MPLESQATSQPPASRLHSNLHGNLPRDEEGYTQHVRTPYQADFFADLAETAGRSATIVVPRLLQLLEPITVYAAFDVGCGSGAWLAQLRRLGVETTLGVDGEYVDPAWLLIPSDDFVARDLSRQPLDLDRLLREHGLDSSDWRSARGPGRPFDLALCLEVAEHLPAEAAPGLVETLTTASPVVAFSAAIPHQGGTHHVNEQWPAYWAELFAARGFTVVDPLRDELWGDPRVDYYYAQNLLLFVDADQLDRYPKLAAAHTDARPEALARVHPRKWIEVHDPKRQLLRPLLKALPHAVKNALLRRLPGRRRS